jgi:hypothetical protein
MFTPLMRFAVTIVVLVATRSFVQCESIPKDAELVALFRSHHDAFEKLGAMGTEDTGNVSYLSAKTLNERPLTDGRQNLSPERRSEYIRLITSIKPDLVMGIDAYQISFSYSVGGALSIGPRWMKGIAYLPHGYDRVGVVVTNLDKLPTQDDTYLVPIEPKWCIIYIQLD